MKVHVIVIHVTSHMMEAFLLWVIVKKNVLVVTTVNVESVECVLIVMNTQMIVIVTPAVFVNGVIGLRASADAGAWPSRRASADAGVWPGLRAPLRRAWPARAPSASGSQRRLGPGLV